jgi:hypothetical protein
MVLLISFAARAIVLTLLLWLMIKLQKLDYNFPGLLGSAALASALDMIPYFGHYLAVAILYLCVWKVTHASLMPDAVFTVAVAYALMLAANLFLFPFILPPLYQAVSGAAPLAPDDDSTTEAASGSTNAPTTNNPTLAAEASKSTNDWLNEITFKGATENGEKSTLLIAANKTLVSLEMNHLTVVRTASGSCKMRLLQVSDGWATLDINGETNYLKLH